MTSCVRVRCSITTSSRVSPTFSCDALRAMSPLLLLLDHALGAHAHAAGRDDQVAVLVAVLGDRLREVQLAAALSLALPGLARLARRGEHVARAQRPVVLEVLLGVEPARGRARRPRAAARPAAALARGRPALHAARLLARAEPGLADLRAQEVVGVELRARLRERRRRDDPADLAPGRELRVRVDRVRVVDRPREHQDVARLDRELLDRHGSSLVRPLYSHGCRACWTRGAAALAERALHDLARIG